MDKYEKPEMEIILFNEEETRILTDEGLNMSNENVG